MRKPGGPSSRPVILTFTIEAEPFGKERPRFSGHAYTPKETVIYERAVKAKCREVMTRAGVPAGAVMFDQPVVVDLTFRLFPPKSHAKWLRRAMLDGVEPITGRYDLDNMAKAILDAINKTAFTDDRLIVDLRARKTAAETTGTDVMIWPFGEHYERPHKPENH